jgi:hypothetical protein
MLAKADKGKATVTIDKDAYNQKAPDFLHDNSFQNIAKDPMEQYQKQIQYACTNANR